MQTTRPLRAAGGLADSLPNVIHILCAVNAYRVYALRTRKRRGMKIDHVRHNNRESRDRCTLRTYLNRCFNNWVSIIKPINRTVGTGGRRERREQRAIVGIDSSNLSLYCRLIIYCNALIRFFLRDIGREGRGLHFARYARWIINYFPWRFASTDSTGTMISPRNCGVCTFSDSSEANRADRR